MSNVKCQMSRSLSLPGPVMAQRLDLEATSIIAWLQQAPTYRLTGDPILKQLIAFIMAAAVFSSATAYSQTRRRSTRTPARPTTATKISEAQRQGAMRVADQIKTLTKFLYLLGGVAKGIEQMDEAAGRNEASPAILEQAKSNKATVRTSIQNIRVGLDKLEIDFRTTPDLQRYYIKLAGSAAGAAAAEQQAAANQFDQAGRSLLSVVNRLTDVLLEMR
jgi:hypothetical protein